MTNILNTPLIAIKGIGYKTIEVLATMNLHNVRDILFNIPYRVSASAEFSKAVSNGDKIIIRGIVNTRVVSQFYGRGKNRSFFSIETNLGALRIVFFNQSYLKNKITVGQEVTIKGIYNSANHTVTASSISFSKEDNMIDSKHIEVVYHLKQGITKKKYLQIVKSVFDFINDKEIIDLVPKNFKGIWDLKTILENLHFPSNVDQYEKAKKMFAFHELLHYQLKLQLQSTESKIKDNDYIVDVDDTVIENFKETLPFSLTKSQNLVIDEIIKDLNSPYPMDRLLQGDVGCGKTVVAASLIYGVVKKGYQCAIMAPTEILANQHFETFFDFFKDLDVSIALLTSSTKKKERSKILQLLKNGEIDLLVGTHSLIEADIVYKNLKFVIIDEQHRFGVNQRKLFSDKGSKVNSLMMTATPIPRSLAITLISDIKVSTIEELPSGRKKIETYKASSKQFEKVLDNLVLELKKGRQAYVICPLIEESEKIDLKHIDEIYDKMRAYLPKDYIIDIVHGKMKNSEKDDIIDKFLKQKIHILISTTVIEVGVNVPNASFMIIVDANRFGLATLHQLRGRVGRSSHQSYCVLIADKKSERIDIMCLENDGFKIAEFDLKQRGPGDFFGTKQSGLPSFKVADLINDTELMYLAKNLAQKLIEVTQDNQKLKEYLTLEKTIY